MNTIPNRQKALEILHEHIKSPQLIRHSLAVAACMQWHAEYYNIADAEKELWYVTGLLHDFDYELHPDPITPDGHPFWGVRYLETQGAPKEMLEAILGHANYSDVPRVSLLSKVLYAVDELSGFVTACVLVRPDKNISELKVSSVTKRFKDKAFAKGCNREDMIQGAQELGVELDKHVENVIAGVKTIADEIGLHI